MLGTASVCGALLLFLCLCLIGFVLVLQLNFYTILLSIVALVLATIYPLMKRVTHLPQLVLDAAFAWSIPMAFAALSRPLSSIVWLLYAVTLLWSGAYDSIYALMDRENDVEVGTKSTAILFGKLDYAIIFLLELFVLAGLTFIGHLLQFNLFFYIAISLAVIMVCYQLFLIRKRTTRDYYRAFANNQWLGCIIFLGIVCNYLSLAS